MKIETSKIPGNQLIQVKVKQLEPGLYIRGTTTYLKMLKKNSEFSVLYDIQDGQFWHEDEWVPQGLQIAPAGHELKFIQD